MHRLCVPRCMRWYLVIYCPIIARSSINGPNIDEQVRLFAARVQARDNDCVPTLTEILQRSVDRFCVTEEGSSENIQDFVRLELTQLNKQGHPPPPFCRVNLLFRSISREYVERIMNILATPARNDFETHIDRTASKRVQTNVLPNHVKKLLKSFHVALQVLAPIMRKYAKLASPGELTPTCHADPRLKDIILGQRTGYSEEAVVESTIWFLKMLYEGDACYHQLSEKSADPDSGDTSFEKFSAEFQAAVNVETEPSPPLSVSVDPTVVSGLSPSQTTLVRSEKSKPSLRTPDTHPRHIVDQSFRSLSIANQETIFFGNLQEAVYKISVLNHESMNAVVHIRTLESYTMVLIKALDHLNQLQKSHKNIDDTLTAVLGDLRTAIGQSRPPAPKDV